MRTTTAVEAFIFRQNKERSAREYLLLHRVPSRGGFWQGLTGGLETTDATLQDCLLRELREELCLTQKDILSIVPEYGSWSFADERAGCVVRITEHGFGVEVRDTFVPTLSDEHDEFRWVSKEQALALLKYETNKEALVMLDALLM